jgi:hypothetical protein
MFCLDPELTPVRTMYMPVNRCLQNKLYAIITTLIIRSPLFSSHIQTDIPTVRLSHEGS